MQGESTDSTWIHTTRTWPKKNWLRSDDDLFDMYAASKCDITIWCYGPAAYSEPVWGRKRQSASAPKTFRYDADVDKMAEVTTIEDCERSTLESILISS